MRILKLINSKKAKGAIGAIVLTVVSSLLAFWRIEMTSEMQITLTIVTEAIIGLIIGFYMLSQGIADAGSGGRTSANYKQPVTETFEDFTDAIKGMGLELRKTRKARVTSGWKQAMDKIRKNEDRFKSADKSD